MHRWYQIELEMDGLLLPGKEYRHKNEDGSDMVELHVDEPPDSKFLTRIDKECRFGGNLSVRRRKEERPISFGQNECIFCQFIFTGSAWTGPKGE
jgi:hypothetical protein